MITPAASIDTETRSAVDLRAAGVRPYFEHPSTRVLCMSWRVGDGPIHDWRPGDPDPVELLEHIKAGRMVSAHKNNFDRSAWNMKLAPANLWPRISIRQSDCTMARAQAAGLPASLDALGTVLNTSVQKDKEGYRLMMKLCKDSNPEPTEGELRRLTAYCNADVGTERAIAAKLPPLTPDERAIWELDQHINARGVQLDQVMVRTALALAEELLRRANAKIRTLTGGAVEKVTQTARIVRWLCDRGIPCESVAKDETEELIIIADMVSDDLAIQVIELRQASVKAFKFGAMLAQSCADGRARDQLLYSATVSRRWVGQGIQFHNMKRVETDEDAADVELAVRILHSGVSPAEMADRFELLFDKPLDTLSICSRACVIAKDGHKLIGGDYSNIEGRIAAWIAGEEWKLQAFRDFDTLMPKGQGYYNSSDGTWRKGPDLYKVTAAGILNITVEEVSKPQRQETGKVSELSFQFQGALNAYKKQGAKYGVRLTDGEITPKVIGWRNKNAKTTDAWRILQDAAIEAVSAPGCVVSVLDGMVKYVCTKGFLYCQLPSGGIIPYASPSVAWKSKTIVIDGDEIELNRFTVSYWGVHKGWRQIDLYGGMQFAHVVSGTARDVMAKALLRMEVAGYNPCLSIHDEGLGEIEARARMTAEGLRELLLEREDWMEWQGRSLPLAAATWEGNRYVK